MPNELNLSILPDVTNQSGELKALRDTEWQACADSFWYFMTYVQTMDEDSGRIRQFPINYEYLHKLDYIYENNQKIVILKSRRLLVSWFSVCKMLWGAMFAGTHNFRYAVYRGGIASKDEDAAIYMLDRVRFVIKNLPDWMQDRSKVSTNNKMMISFENGSVLQAFAMQGEGPHGYGFTDFLFDEIALQPAARSTWGGLLPTLGAHGHVIAVSTPKGKTNFFYDLWSETGQYKNILRHTIHWTDNIEHDEGWFARTTSGMSKDQIEQEFNLSFAVYGGKQVFPEFEYATHTIPETLVIPGKPILLGWDFGYHFPAISFWQYNTLDQFVGHAEIQGKDMSFDRFCKEAKVYAESLYERAKWPEIHFVDPAGFQHYHSRGVSGAMSDVQEVRSAWKIIGREVQLRPGIQDIGTRQNEGPRLKEVRKLFALRQDGRPGIVISRKMEMFIEGLQGGYHYPEKGGETPDKSSESSHLQDTLQYVVTGHNRMYRGETGAKMSRRERRERLGLRTGI